MSERSSFLQRFGETWEVGNRANEVFFSQSSQDCLLLMFEEFYSTFPVTNMVKLAEASSCLS
ncbi:TPA: hypothetical protein ACT2FI_002114, partial [Streptococcus suis]